MELSSELISQFVKVTKDEPAPSNGTTVTGTATLYGGKIYVQLDGSDQLTPVLSSTAGVKDGDRVTVLIKNHSATVTGNTSSPSAGQGDIEDAKTEIGNKISEVEILIADKVDTIEFNAEKARIDELVAENVTIKGDLTAVNAKIDNIEAGTVTTDDLEAINADIENLKATKIDADIADLKYATIGSLEATNADIHNLEVDYGSFKDLTTEKFSAVDAEITKLDTEKLSADEAELKYANIDFANIGKAAIENFFSKSGMIGDLVVGDGTITGTLVGVTIKGDLIEGGTVVADKLVLKGTDGLYYKLNTTGETVSAEQTEYNSLNGSIITAKSVTAEKINVNDLVAFGATIGGFKITEDSLYSGVKESANNTTRGIFMGDDGQFAVGDSSNFLKFYKDTDGTWKLAISASQIKLGTSGKDVEEVVSDAVTKAVNDISVGARNLIIRKTEEKDKYIDASGNVVAWVDHSVSDYIEITPGTEYMFSRNESDVSDGGYFRYAWYTSAKAYIGRASNAELEFSWSSPSNAYFIRISYPTECKVKFERGNKATDWTPAPEDMATSDEVQNAQDTANGASDKADATDGRVTVAEATIQILQDSIMSLVTDEDGSSMMTQNGSGWTFNIGAILNSVDAAADQLNDLSGTLNNVDSAINNLQSLADDLVKKTAYIIMTQDDTGAPCIELGKEDNPFKVRITNTSVDFMEGTSKIAYVSNQAMFIKKAIIKEELQIGEGEGFVWRKRSNGNMGLRWVGGGS